MESSKIHAGFDALVRFHKTTSQFKTKAEEIAHVRVIVTKLQQALQSQENIHRDVLLRKANYAQSLVLTLQAVSDRDVHLATANCMLELLGQTKTGQRARIFVRLGATQAVCQAIASEWRSSAVSESALLQLHLVLARLGPKDKRLATKARLCQCAPVVLNLLRHGLSGRGAGPLLRLLRAYAVSRQSSTSLGRHGAVQLLLRLLSEGGRGGGAAGTAAAWRQPQPGPMRQAAEALAQITRARANASRAIASGASAALMELLRSIVTNAPGSFGTSASGSQQQRQRAPLLRAIIQILRNITVSKAGRAAFHSAGGPDTLYNLCLRGASGSSGELLSAGACIVLRYCAPRVCLPVPSPLSPYTPAMLELLVSLAASVTVDADADTEDPEDSTAFACDSDEEDSSGNGDAKKQQQQQQQKQQSGQFANDGIGGPDPRSADELRSVYGHLEPELLGYDPMIAKCALACSAVQLIPSPSLPSLANLAVGQPVVTSQYLLADRRLSVSATSALLAPAAASSALRSRSIAGLPEQPSPTAAAPSSVARSLVDFVIAAGPELSGVCPPPRREACDTRRSECANDLMLEDARRWIDPSDVLNRVVFDLDALVAEQRHQQPPRTQTAPPAEDERLLTGSGADHLIFESRFESGNLRRAIQIREREYDLVMNPDIGHKGHTQWFYFRLANVQPNVAYRFNIINCEKPNSQFNCGMRPLLFSNREAQLGRPHWFRAGNRVCYYRNHYQRAKQTGTKPYYTASFSLTFRHLGDVCYVAYYVPYTYSRLMSDLDDWRLVASRDASVAFYQQWLCQSLGGNRLPLLTVTAPAADMAELRDRPCVFITGRVHPGEANASWVVRGLVAHLLSPSARFLRRRFVFKIVPMLNPDGVINGNHRCSLAVEDLNRTWLAPSSQAHPEIFHCKGLLSYLCSSGRRPVVYIDCHGHSRHNNVFMFGCSPSLSWLPDDRDNPGWLPAEPADVALQDDESRPVSGAVSVGGGGRVWIEDQGYRELPRLLAQMAPAFAWRTCNFKVDRTKESTARVVAWRHLGILRAYTLEASYSCCDQGPYKGCHMGTRELEEMGARLAEALLRWAEGESPCEDPPADQLSPSSAALSGRGAGATKSKAAAAAVGQDDYDDDDDEEEDDDADEDHLEVDYGVEI